MRFLLSLTIVLLFHVILDQVVYLLVSFEVKNNISSCLDDRLSLIEHSSGPSAERWQGASNI